MIKFSALYPGGEGKTFDMDYYYSKHIPLVRQLLGDFCRNSEVEQGLSGFNPGSEAPYIAAGHLYFDKMEDLTSSFAPHLDQILADIQNFTNTSPIIQISEMKK